MGDTRDATLDRLIEELRDDLTTLPGLRRCFDRVPDNLHNQYPAIVIYPVSGTWRLGSHAGERGKPMRVALHTIRIDLYVARKDLARDMDVVLAFSDTLPDWVFAGFKRDAYGGPAVTLGDPRGSGNIASNPFRYEIVPIQYGDDQTMCWRCELDVTIHREIDV